jgi:hypothetical protein
MELGKLSQCRAHIFYLFRFLLLGFLFFFCDEDLSWQKTTTIKKASLIIENDL